MPTAPRHCANRQPEEVTLPLGDLLVWLWQCRPLRCKRPPTAAIPSLACRCLKCGHRAETTATRGRSGDEGPALCFLRPPAAVRSRDGGAVITAGERVVRPPIPAGSE